MDVINLINFFLPHLQNAGIGVLSGIALAWAGYMSKPDKEFDIMKAGPLLISGALTGFVTGLFGLDTEYLIKFGVDGFIAKVGVYAWKAFWLKLEELKQYLMKH